MEIAIKLYNKQKVFEVLAYNAISLKNTFNSTVALLAMYQLTKDADFHCDEEKLKENLGKAKDSLTAIYEAINEEAGYLLKEDEEEDNE